MRIAVLGAGAIGAAAALLDMTQAGATGPLLEGAAAVAEATR